MAPPNTVHTTRTELIALVVLLLLTLGASFFTTAAAFKSFTDTDILAIVTSMFVVAVFMERSIEAILTPIRAHDRQQIKKELDDILKLPETTSDRQEQIRSKEHELQMYRLTTAKMAYWMSFVFGLAISLVGVRTLEGLVTQETLESLTVPQRGCFTFGDVVLTGGVISGGSAAIDKIGRKIREFYKLNSAADTRETDKKPEGGEQK